MEHDSPDFEAFRQLYESVTKLPELVSSHQEFLAAMETHTPPSLRNGGPTRVLLSIAVAASGEVEGVRAVRPSLPGGMRAIAIHTDESGRVVREIDDEPTLDSEAVAAAEAIGRTLRFRPAEIDGSPVPFPDYRMSIAFGGRHR